VAECSPPELRGFMIGIQQFAIEFGIMVSFWIVSTQAAVGEVDSNSCRIMAVTSSAALDRLSRTLPGFFHWVSNWLRQQSFSLVCFSCPSRLDGSFIMAVKKRLARLWRNYGPCPLTMSLSTSSSWRSRHNRSSRSEAYRPTSHIYLS
jgi:hypothetical protein